MQGYMYDQKQIDNLEISFIFDLLAIKDDDNKSENKSNAPKKGFVNQLF